MEPRSTSSARLDPNARIIVMIPADGAYGNKKYPGSGRMTADALRSAFLRHARFVSVVNGGEEFDKALETSRLYGNEIMIVPTSHLSGQ